MGLCCGVERLDVPRELDDAGNQRLDVLRQEAAGVKQETKLGDIRVLPDAALDVAASAALVGSSR